MANRESYEFDIRFNTGQARNEIKDMQAEIAKLEKMAEKGANNFDVLNQRDVSNSMKSISAVMEGYEGRSDNVKQQQERIGEQQNRAAELRQRAEERGNTNRVQQLDRYQNTYAQEQEGLSRNQDYLDEQKHRAFRSQRQISRYSVKRSADADRQFEQKTGDPEEDEMTPYNEETEEIMGQTKESTEGRNNLKKLRSRTQSLYRQGMSSGYFSHMQAEGFKDDARTANEMSAMHRPQEESRIEQGNNKIESLKQERQNIVSNPDYQSNTQQQKYVQQLNNQIDALQRQVKTSEDFVYELDTVNAELRRMSQNLQEAGTEQKPERGTMKGMLYERAPAVALASTGMAAGIAGGMYMKGEQVKSQSRETYTSIGQRTDNYNEDGAVTGRLGTFRDVRRNAEDQGIEGGTGFTGTEMLQFQDTYLNSAGYTNDQDMNTSMQNQAEFSRTTGIDQEGTMEFFESMYRTGGVDAGSTKQVRDGFIGAIKQSGMEGREKEQLSALQTITEQNAQGRTLDQADISNIMGMQTMFADTGERSLQGEQGAQALSGLDEGIKSGINDNTSRMIFGQGTTYQGLEGQWELRKQMEKGIADPENLNTLFRTAQGAGSSQGAQNEAFAKLASEQFGTNLSAEQTEGIMDIGRERGFTDETLEDVKAQIESEGAAEGEERMENYEDSTEGSENRSEATTEKQSTRLNDMASIVKEVNNAMGGLNPVIYAATYAMAGFVSSMGGSMAWGTVGEQFRKRTANKYKDGTGGTQNNQRSNTNNGNGGGGNGSGGGSGGSMFIPGGGGDGSGKRGFFGRTSDRIRQFIPGNNPSKPNYNQQYQQPQQATAPNTKEQGVFGKLASTVGGFIPGFRKSKPNYDQQYQKTNTSKTTTNTTDTTTKEQGFFGKVKNTAKNLNPFNRGGGDGGNKQGILPQGDKQASGGLKGTVGKLGKGMMPLNLLMAGHSVMNAPEGQAGSTVGGSVGQIAGGMIGTGLGSFLGPVGGIAGAMIGSNLGSKAGSAIGGLFDPSVAEAGTPEAGDIDSPTQGEDKELNAQDANATTAMISGATDDKENQKTLLHEQLNAQGMDVNKKQAGQLLDKYNENGAITDADVEDIKSNEMAETDTPKEDKDPKDDKNEKKNKDDKKDKDFEADEAASESYSYENEEAPDTKDDKDSKDEKESKDDSDVKSESDRRDKARGKTTEESGNQKKPKNERDRKDQEEKTPEQLEKELANQREKTENKRSKNISREKEVFQYFSDVVDKFQTAVNNLAGANLGTGGTAESGNYSGNVSGNDNQEKTFNYLKDQGFSDEAASGIIGNLMQESQLDPKARQSGGGKGRGIMQWTEGERWDNLKNWTKDQGLDPESLEGQLQFMMHEMNGGDSYGADQLQKNYGGMDNFKNMTDPKEATRAFESSFERAGTPNYDNRYKYAEDALSQFKGNEFEIGGTVKQEQLAKVGERNKEEVIIPMELHRPRALKLLDYAQNKLRGKDGKKQSAPRGLPSSSSTSTSSSTSANFASYDNRSYSEQAPAASSRGGGEMTSNGSFQVNIDISVSGDESVADKVRDSGELERVGDHISRVLRRQVDSESHYAKELARR